MACHGAAGDLDRAHALAQSITNPERQAEVLGDLAKAAARAGDLDRAQALAQSITKPAQKARTLAELARSVKPDEVHSILAWALAIDDWQPLVEVLLEVDPRAVDAIADEYLSATP